eukprot:TRINITY_DN96775_c0_g1_i1.p1 TRINITY_DN96775_c0_g1~~TRINITY_DN96775_c0_g1_i1.p1  ORF type:complete len:121 (-),score=36.45 TRINITY_DN96775_c0_g1_i1:31-393(-)
MDTDGKGKGKGKDQDVADKYTEQHAPVFAGFSQEAEQRLEYTEIFNGYISLLDGHLAAFLSFMKLDESQLIAALNNKKSCGGEAWEPFAWFLQKDDFMAFAYMLAAKAQTPQGAEGQEAS